MIVLYLKNKIKLKVLKEYPVNSESVDYKCLNRTGEVCFLSIRKEMFFLKDKNNNELTKGKSSIVTKEITFDD